MSRALALLLLAACSGGTSETGDTGPGFGDGPTGLWPVPSLPECDGPGPNCVDHAVWSDACAADPAPIDSAVVVYEGPLGDDQQPAVQIITDSTTWADLLGSEVATRTVDFSVEQVVVVRYDISSTCSARVSSKGLGSDGTLRVSLEDSSGACEEVCDMHMSFGVAFAVPAGDAPAVCLAVVNTCQP